MLKPFNTKLDARQIELLDKVSAATHIPKAVLVRQAIDILIDEYKEDIISPEFTKLVDKSLRQNIRLLKKLSKA